VGALKRLDGGLADLSIDDNQCFERTQPGQVGHPAIPHGSVAQVENLDMGKVLEQRQIFVCHTSIGQ